MIIAEDIFLVETEPSVSHSQSTPLRVTVELDTTDSRLPRGLASGTSTVESCFASILQRGRHPILL